MHIYVPSHPIAASISRLGIPIVYHAFKTHMDPDFIWYPSTQLYPSVLGIVQMLTEKSSTTVNVPAFTSYPLHYVFHNFDESVRRRLFFVWDTVVGYLPCTLFISVKDTAVSISTSVSRAEKIASSM